MSCRADRWLKDHYPGLSQSQAEEALSNGWLWEGGRPLRKGDRVESPDDGKLKEHLKRLRLGSALESVREVLSGDGWVGVDKPAGMHGHPLRLEDHQTLTHWAFHRYPETRELFPAIQPTLVPHRLDGGTCGLQIVALRPEAFDRWRRWFQNGEIAKEYLAWVQGTPTWENQRVVWAIGHDPQRKGKMVALATTEVGHRPPVQSAATEFTVVERRGARTLLRAQCTTGVTHQVRVHAAALDLPLVGDALYGQAASWGGRPSHWLRAVALRSPEGEFRIEEESFRRGGDHSSQA